MVAVKRTKLINASRVMREIWVQRRISRVDIANSLGLNKSTITHLVNELMECGLVRADSVGSASPQGGRKPIYLTLNEKFGCVLGIECRPESYHAVAVNLVGDMIFSKTERVESTGDTLGESFREILYRLEPDLKRTGTPLLGIGAGLSGVIDPRKQIIRYSIPLKIESRFDFYEKISKGHSVPVFPENDANCCAWGELAFHREFNLRNFIFVLVEFRDIPDEKIIHEKTAVGMGIVIDGKVYYGSDFSAGEFMSVFRSPQNQGQFSLSRDEVVVVDTDETVRRKFIRELSRNIALMVNTFNLSMVFLGGDIEKFQTEVTGILQEEIERNWAYPGPVDCEIRFSTLRDQAVAYGAAGMVLDRLFMDLGQAGSDDVMRFSGIDRILHYTSP